MRFRMTVLCAAVFSAMAAEPDDSLRPLLKSAGFTGQVGQSLEKRLGRPLDQRLINLGRILFFDTSPSLHGDNSCAGCHAPNAGFGDSQPIAIGILNNGVVGRERTGPRNQRRTPTVVNSAFYPKLMWNGRFAALSGDPFNSSKGFTFPDPEGTTRFPASDSRFYHLLVAQAHIPPTELVEVAGFRGTRGSIDPVFDQFDDFEGTPVPLPDSSGFRNEPIRNEILKVLNGHRFYRDQFARIYPPVAEGGPIDFAMFGQAVAEFEFSLTFADAPLDRYARGDFFAMTEQEKRGAVLFFGSARCVTCHAVAGASNEMFSDFDHHNIAVPQISPAFGRHSGNVVFDGPNQDEDFGLEQVTGLRADRYKFRTSPLRNVALQPAFFHNGAYTRLVDAIRHHTAPEWSSLYYSARASGLPADLIWRRAPARLVTATIDPLLRPVSLTSDELDDLVAFVGNGLLDPRARDLCGQIPRELPSGKPLPVFQGCGR